MDSGLSTADRRDCPGEVVCKDGPEAILQALNAAVWAKGLAALSWETGMPVESLRQSLSEKGDPCLGGLWKVASALGYALALRQKNAVGTPPRPSGKMLRAKDAAALLGIGESTFWKWVQEGRLPKGIKLSPKATVWDEDGLRSYVGSLRP